MRSRSFRWIWLALAFSGCASPPRPPVVANQAAAVTRVIVRHALMTYVMDSPAGQRDKARAAVETSKLLEAITARVGRHVEIEIRFDAAAGDDVIVDRDGHEVGRASLHDVAAGVAPVQILDRL